MLSLTCNQVIDTCRYFFIGITFFILPNVMPYLSYSLTDILLAIDIFTECCKVRGFQSSKLAFLGSNNCSIGTNVLCHIPAMPSPFNILISYIIQGNTIAQSKSFIQSSGNNIDNKLSTFKECPCLMETSTIFSHIFIELRRILKIY